jgi:hypothetical protein
MDNNRGNYILRRKTIFVFLLIFSLIPACNREKGYQVYKGEKLSIYFDLLYDYTEKDFFFIDDYPVVHMKQIVSPLIRNDSIFIYPRRFVYMDHPKTGPRREKTTNLQMAIGLFYGLKEINKKSGSTDQYVFDSPQYMLTIGELIIKKKSGKTIKIKVPDDYPVTIKVLKR